MGDQLPMMNENYNNRKWQTPHVSGSDSMLYSSPKHRVQKSVAPASHSDQIKKMSCVALGTGSTWAFEIISHPFIVLRRSCQVYYPSYKYHLTPVTLMPTLINLNRNKPPSSMYKGFWSTIITRGMNVMCENLVAEFTNWPLTVSSHSSVKKHCQHLLLKGTGFLITAPFYVSSFVETVQSHGANDIPTLFEFFTEGFNRLIGRGMHQTTWIVPMWRLLLPTVTLKLCHYSIQSIAIYAVMRAKTEKQQESHDNSSPVDGNISSVSLYDQLFPLLLATFTGTFLADLFMYPFETVLHRLYIQGTRVLIDNMDTGLEVTGIQTQYAGLIDCFRKIIVDEGFFGLYKGFGAFMLQFTIHAVGLKMVQYLCEKISQLDYSNDNVTTHQMLLKK